MRRISYAVAMSPDGYIAGPKGEADWIVMDPDIDFAALLDRDAHNRSLERSFMDIGSVATHYLSESGN